MTTRFERMGQLRKVCSIAIAVAGAIRGQAVTPTPRLVLFALEQQANGSFLLEPLLEREKGRLQMPSNVDQATNCRSFPSEYTRDGKSYSLLFGGARVGTATLEGGGKAAVSFTRAIRLPQMGGSEGRGAGEMALVTDSKALGRATASRRPPTTEERAAARSLARSQFRQKGVPSAMLARFAIEQLTSTDLNHDGAQDLIGAWRIDESPLGRSHSLFFVAERLDDSYRLSMVKYHSGMGETYGFEQLVDHVDLDGDGNDELITRNSGWEWYTYRVYSRRGAGWIPIYEGHGCEGM